jgi:2-polyprenyl-6-methoxyphenol hydroxylase-like FAD-dependent oxidoreductase
MRLDSTHILIVGAATGGAASAVLLARAGARVTLIERAPEIRSLGAGIALAANGRAVLERVGVHVGHAAALVGARVADAQGRTLLLPPPGSELAVVTRAELQRGLLAAVEREPRIQLLVGCTLERATPDGLAVLRDAEGSRVMSCDLIVGADGVHSTLRDCGNFGARVQRSGIRYARALSDLPCDDAAEAWTSQGLFGHLPVDGGTYWYASCGTPALSRALATNDLRMFQASWENAYAPSAKYLASLSSLEEMLVHEVIRVDCERWSDQRLVLLGDAAHAMAPNLGQGANSALVDAAVLADEIVNASTLPAALDAYTTRRRAKVKRVADTAERLGRIAEIVHPVGRLLRDRLLLPLAAKANPDKQRALLLQESPTLLAGHGGSGTSAQSHPRLASAAS